MKKKNGSNKRGKGLDVEAPLPPRRKKRFNTLLDVKRYLAQAMNDLDRDQITEGKARVTGYLCQVMRDILRDADLEERILKLEQLMEENNNKHNNFT